VKVDARDAGPLLKELEIHLDAEEVGRFIDELIAAYRRRHAFPGFRPGKVSDQVVRSRFHEDIERALFTELVPQSIERAVAEQKLRPAAPGEISAVRYHAGEPLVFTVKFPVWPDLDLRPYEEIEVEQVVEGVSPEQVDAFLGQLRDRAAETFAVEREARERDLLEAELETIDAQGVRVKGTKREKVTLEVGNPNLLPEFREAAAGIATGQSRDFSVKYPEDFAQENLRGETRRYRLRALEIRERKLLPLDDAFAKKLDPHLDLEGLRARIRLRLESERRFAAREAAEERVVEALIAANPFDLPAQAVEGPLNRLIERIQKENPSAKREEVEGAYRQQIERLQRRDFLLARVAEREGIGVTPADVEEEVARIAQEERRTAEEVRRDLGDLERYRQFLFERKVFEALLGKVKVREIRIPARAPAGAAGPVGGGEAPPVG